MIFQEYCFSTQSHRDHLSSIEDSLRRGPSSNRDLQRQCVSRGGKEPKKEMVDCMQVMTVMTEEDGEPQLS